MILLMKKPRSTLINETASRVRASWRPMVELFICGNHKKPFRVGNDVYAFDGSQRHRSERSHPGWNRRVFRPRLLSDADRWRSCMRVPIEKWRRRNCLPPMAGSWYSDESCGLFHSAHLRSSCNVRCGALNAPPNTAPLQIAASDASRSRSNLHRSILPLLSLIAVVGGMY